MEKSIFNHIAFRLPGLAKKEIADTGIITILLNCGCVFSGIAEIKKLANNRRALLTGLVAGGVQATGFSWSRPIVNAVILPAHAITSTDVFPPQLFGIWGALYRDRAVSFRLTINTDGSVGVLQRIATFAGIPLFRADLLPLVSLSNASREIRWSSDRTEISITYNQAFNSIEGLESIGGRDAQAFTATPV